MQSLKKLDTNADRWFSSEIEQMKRIHKVYIEALVPISSSSSEASTTQLTPTTPTESDKPTQADAEPYLPKNSCLRSERGEMLKPALCPFKDFSGFVASTSMDYWSPYFSSSSKAVQHDRVLREIAEAVVSHICLAQSCKELRVRHGSKPLGRFWRAKREQITPLALTMHELKLWAATALTVFNIAEEESYVELSRRVKYVQGLARAQVWGNPTGYLHQGMRPVSHDKLFRLLLTTREDLVRAKDYAFRGFCRRRSREKLAKLGNLLKDVWFSHARALSALLSIEHALEDPKSPRLQPTDLFNQAHNQMFVDYRNAANVLLRVLCDVPLVRAGLLSDYGSFLQGGGVELVLEKWASNDPFLTNSVELVYRDCVDVTLHATLPGAQAKTLLSLSKWRAMLDKALDSESDAGEIVGSLQRVLSGLYNVVPQMYAVHELYGVAGDGGDYTVYDTLRSEVIKCMEDCALRMTECDEALGALAKLVDGFRLATEQRMEQRRIKTKKPEKEPVWAQNFRFAQTEMLKNGRQACAETKKQAGEIARDAFDYSLTKEMLDERVMRFKKTTLALVRGRGGPAGAAPGLHGWPAVFQGLENSDTRHFADLGGALERDLNEARMAHAQLEQPDEGEGGGGLGGHDVESDDEQAGGSATLSAQPGNPFAE